MARKSGARMINSSRFQKYATVLITKQLEQIADNVEKDATKIIEDKLLETYKQNVLASYSPRSEAGQEVQAFNKAQKQREEQDKEEYGIKNRRSRKKLTYRHTNTFVNSIYTEIKNKTVMIKIRDEQYPDGASTTQVYEWLTQGTKGSDKPYPYIRVTGNDATDPNNYSTGWATNYPTPRHLFEEHTREQMKGFLENFEANIKRDYNGRKYRKKRRK